MTALLYLFHIYNILGIYFVRYTHFGQTLAKNAPEFDRDQTMRVYI